MESVFKRVIWSNVNLNLEDWREGLQDMSDYAELTEEELMDRMYELNNDYLDDERVNLDIQKSQPIIAIADIGRWNGRAIGYKIIDSGNISDCLQMSKDCEYGEWYINEFGDLHLTEHHHDGTNYLRYRVFKETVTEQDIEEFELAIFERNLTEELIDKYTDRLGDDIASVYGFTIPTPSIEDEQDM